MAFEGWSEGDERLRFDSPWFPRFDNAFFANASCLLVSCNLGIDLNQI